MSAQLLTLLKFGLLALLYLFFIRVLFSVWSELRPTGKHAGYVPAAAATTATLTGPPGQPGANAHAAKPRRSKTSKTKARPGGSTQVGPAPTAGSSASGTAAVSRAPQGDPFVPVQGQLLVLEPAGLAGLTYELGDELTVGRAPGCGISLDDTFVSSLHARIYRHEGTYVLEDLGSTNGTFLNGGKVVGPNIMHISDTVRFGSMLLELR